MPKISKTSKMKIDGKRVGSWSLPAGDSCPGAKDAEVCKSCYAKKGMYRFPVVKNVREYNKEDYKKSDWVERMTKAVNKFDYFRWFDSGDLESKELATKIFSVIHNTPNVKHWLPTRSDKIRSMRSAIGLLEALPNVAVRRSADNVGLTKPERLNVNSYVITPEDIPNAQLLNITICPVGSNAAQKSCGTCTACYTDTPVAYVLH